MTKEKKTPVQGLLLLTRKQINELCFLLVSSIRQLQAENLQKNSPQWFRYVDDISKRRMALRDKLDGLDGFVGYTDKDEFAVWACFETGSYYIETEETLVDPYNIPMAFAECCSSWGGQERRVRVPCRKEADIPKMLSMMYPEVEVWKPNWKWKEET